MKNTHLIIALALLPVIGCHKKSKEVIPDTTGIVGTRDFSKRYTFYNPYTKTQYDTTTIGTYTISQLDASTLGFLGDPYKYSQSDSTITFKYMSIPDNPFAGKRGTLKYDPTTHRITIFISDHVSAASGDASSTYTSL